MKGIEMEMSKYNLTIEDFIYLIEVLETRKINLEGKLEDALFLSEGSRYIDFLKEEIKKVEIVLVKLKEQKI